MEANEVREEERKRRKNESRAGREIEKEKNKKIRGINKEIDKTKTDLAKKEKSNGNA